MIKSLFDLFKYIFSLIFKGVKYTYKGIAWFLTNFDLLMRDLKQNNKTSTKLVKKEEIL